MSVQPQYAASPICPEVNFSTANTNRDGTGAIAVLATGRAPGTRVERVLVKAAGTTTGGMIRIFKRGSGLTMNADGSIASHTTPTWRLVAEIAVGAVTPSGTLATWEGSWAPVNGFNLERFDQLGISTHNAEAFNAVALGGNL